MGMDKLLLVAGVFLGAWGLRTFAHPFPRRLGLLLLLLGTYLAGWLGFGSHVAGAVAVAGWLFLPWIEILGRVRHLRLPLDKTLKSAFAPSAERFPQLSELTSEIEAEGFVPVDDASFEWEESQQFMRLFHHPEEKCQAAICLLEQGPTSVGWISISARTADERTLTTWNYPFSGTMKTPPETRVLIVLDAGSFGQLLDAHREFLTEHSLETEDLTAPDPEHLVDLIQRETRRQVDHNLDQGLIRLSGQGTFRYSWRGYFFLWRQFLRDLVRLS